MAADIEDPFAAGDDDDVLAGDPVLTFVIEAAALAGPASMSRCWSAE